MTSCVRWSILGAPEGCLDGRVAIVSGAGRGIGREHALLLAAEGAKVLVNDLGAAPDGSGGDTTVAQAVVDEITAEGGQAVANSDSVADWQAAKRIVDTAVETFGDLHVVVNNAWQGRARTLLNTTEQLYDAFFAVHLKGSFAMTRWAAAYWRDQAAVGVDRAIVNTSSGAGLHGTAGSSGYAEAKAGIAAMTMVAATELEPYGVRVNCIVPTARTRGSDDVRVRRDSLPSSVDGFDVLHPGNAHRSSRTWPRRTAPSPAKCSRSPAVRSACTRAGRSRARSVPTTGGRSPSSPSPWTACRGRSRYARMPGRP